MKKFTLNFFCKIKMKRVTKQPQEKGAKHGKQPKKIIFKKLI
jgi:hypothetical protein